MSQQSPIVQLSQKAAAAGEELEVYVDMIVGHRSRLEAAEFSKDAAEMMCVQLHQRLMGG